MAKENSTNNESPADRSTVIYQQNYEEFRSLNKVMWQVPVLVMTFTGGIWFGIESANLKPFPSFILYGLVAIGNFQFVKVLWRLRLEVMDPILNIIYEYEQRDRSLAKYTVIKAFRVLMYSAASVSLLFALLNLGKGLWPYLKPSLANVFCP